MMTSPTPLTREPRSRRASRRPALLTAVLATTALGACFPMPGETIYVRSPDNGDDPVQVVRQSYLDDGTEEPIHAVQLNVPPTQERRVRFDLVRESVVTAGTLSQDASGGVGFDASEDVLVEVLPVGTYDLVVTAPSGADILLGAKPVATASGTVPVQHAAFVQGWIFRAVMNAIAKRVAKEGLSGICPFTRAMYEQYGNECPIEFESVPFCIVGYGITCATPVY
ncbi:MAG: hypothetical protein EP329_24785 [Deltaproteobacteria bacterium]|nr:MAG: hypothetical protein EP329_24785 [Deltaproteobacteria bacterium]